MNISNFVKLRKETIYTLTFSDFTQGNLDPLDFYRGSLGLPPWVATMDP